jgi:hypothetical protein
VVRANSCIAYTSEPAFFYRKSYHYKYQQFGTKANLVIIGGENGYLLFNFTRYAPNLLISVLLINLKGSREAFYTANVVEI